MLHGCPSIDEWYRDVPRSARFPTMLGFSLLLVMGCGFGAWATLAPLASAVVAAGSFVATGQNKQVQHLEGGIIREMLVKEGDGVQANQTLLRLDDTAVRAKLRRLVLRKYRLMATSARLEAEIHSFDTLRIPTALAEAAADPVVMSVIHSQERELAAWRNSIVAQEEVLKKEIAGLQESIRGYQSQVASNQARVALFDEEIKSKSSLLEQQLIRKSEVLALQRSQASLSGEFGELLGRIGDARERSARAEQQIVQLRSATIQKATEELRGTETELDDIQEQILAAQDVVNRTEVQAPVRGIVVKLNQHTPGGVIAPGAVILELLPINDELIIEARVNPTEISHVKEGQDALVRLSSLNQRLTPMIQGKVIYLSADIVPDQSARRESDVTKHDSFIVRVQLDQRDLAEKIENFSPTPGMPADIFIQTGQRTFFNYLMRPILDSFSRAFREH
jgi:HlyD family type I secretion membrane fusion protein